MSFEVVLRYVWGAFLVQISKCDDIETQILNAHKEELSNEYNLNIVLQESSRLGSGYEVF